MSRQKSAITSRANVVPVGLAELWSGLTWEDFDEWTDSRSVQRGRTYQRDGHVRNLGITDDGRLLADVIGSDRYVTTVWRTNEKSRAGIESKCSCPVGFSGCKHAVAVVAEYLSVLAHNGQLPAVTDDDRRWAKLDGHNESGDDESDEDDDVPFYEDDSDSDDDELDATPAKKPFPARKSSPRKASAKDWKASVQEHINSLSHDQLAGKLWSLTQEYPEVFESFREQLLSAGGQKSELVAEARREMKRVTSERGWEGNWREPGHTPDYSKLKRLLERLVELGQADAVVELGRELLDAGWSQVDQSHDEGETGMQLATCLSAVFAAVQASSLSPSQKILFAIDVCLRDDFDMVGDSVDCILDAKWTPADWSLVADQLQARLTARPTLPDSDYSSRYRFERINSWLLTALENAGRGAELLAAYERDARATNDPRGLIRFLLSQGQQGQAKQWAGDGIRANIAKYPGIANDLGKTLCDLARQNKQWDVVAAHEAVSFFERPSASGFADLMKAAKKAKCEEKVRSVALKFLESGQLPFEVTRSFPPASRQSNVMKSRVSAAKVKPPSAPTCAPITRADVKVHSDWPLPLTDEMAVLLKLDAPRREPRPHLDVLLDMSLEAKRPDDILHWFDSLSKNEKGLGYNAYGFSSGYSDRVAAAVAASHPERSLELYRAQLEAALPHANFSAYEAATKYLRLMRPILKSLDREAEWTQQVADIRQTYRNRPRFMELLDKHDGRTILETEKTRRKR